MRVPTADYTSQQNALANKYSAKSGKYLTQSITLAASNANVAQKALQLSEKSLALSQKSQENSEAQALAQQQYYSSMASLNKWQLGLNTVQSLVSGVYSIVQARDESKAKTALLDILSENDTKTTTSIANKKSKFVINSETGEMEPVIDSELTEWQNTQIEKIKAMGLTKDVEQSAINSLQSAFSESKNTILSGIANDAAQELQEYNTILENNALGQDLYAVSFDEFINPEVDESSKYASGYSLIDGRTYLSDSEKKTAKESYRLSSNEQRSQYYVAEAVKSGGKSAAYTRVEQLRDYLNLDDATCTKLLQYADTVDSQYTDTLTSRASETMSKGLSEGLMPDDIYRQIVQEIEGESSEHRNAAMQGAINAHITWATADASGIIAGYTTADEAGLALMLSNLEARSAYYNGGAEEVFTSAVKAVSNQLSTIASPEAAAAIIDNVDLVKDNAKAVNAQNEGYLNAVKEGKLSGYDAAYAIETTSLKFSPEYLSSLLDINSENYDPELYAEILTSQNSSSELVQKALESYKDNPLYSTFSDIVKDAEKNLLTIWGIDEENLYKDKNVEKKAAYTHFKAYVSGSIIDLMNETLSSELTADQIYARYEDIKNIAISENWSTLTSGTIMDSVSSNPTESALKMMQTFVDNPGTVYYNDYTGNIVWLDEDMKSTFENAAYQIKEDLSDRFNLKLDSAPIITLDESGTSAYPVAEFKADNGNRYRVNPTGSVFVVGKSGNLIYYGELQSKDTKDTEEEPTLPNGKTPTQVLADTLATVTPEEAIEALVNLRPITEEDRPTAEEEREMVKQGASPEEILDKRMESFNPNKYSLVPETTEMSKEDKEAALKVLEEGPEKLVKEGYYGQGTANLINSKGSEQTLPYAARLEQRTKEIMKEEGLSMSEARKKAVEELGGNR